MIHEISVRTLPEVTRAYFVQRRTVWQIADPDTLLIFVTDGRCRITINNREYILTKGSVLFIPPKQHYIRRPIENEMCTLYYAHLRLYGGVSELSESEAANIIDARIKAHRSELISGERRSDGQKHNYLITALNDLTDKFDDVMALWNELIASIKTPHAQSATDASLAAVRILLLLALNEEDSSQSSPVENNTQYIRLRMVINYIHMHAKEPITLDDLCTVCNFSKQHLIRVFKAEFGQTPKAYILEHRINVAKEIIFRNPYISVKEVADEMGFEDQSYFSRIFCKVAGISPTDYKKHLLTFDPSKQ